MNGGPKIHCCVSRLTIGRELHKSMLTGIIPSLRPRRSLHEPHPLREQMDLKRNLYKIFIEYSKLWFCMNGLIRHISRVMMRIKKSVYDNKSQYYVQCIGFSRKMTRDDLNVCLNRALKFYMTRTRVGSED